MNVTVSPQSAVNAGCTAIHTSNVSYSDTYTSSSGDETYVDEFNGTFPIIEVYAPVGWIVLHVSGEVKITTTKKGNTTTRTETVTLDIGKPSGDVTINLLEVLKSKSTGNWYPIAEHGTNGMNLFNGQYIIRRYPILGEVITSYDLLSLEVAFGYDYSEVTIRTISSPTAGGSTSGGGTYRVGSSVTLTATSNSGYLFLNWTKDGKVVSNNSTYSFIASEDARYVAVFEEVSRKFTITTSAFPVGGGVTSGDGRYSRGEPVTIRAVANPGYKFHVWKKGVLVVAGGSGIYAFSAKEDAEYVAYFKPCGIIYDPSSGKIMYDANAGSILCYA